MKLIIGIDPGLDGAVAFLVEGKVVIKDTPTLTITSGKKKKREYDYQGVAEILKKHCDIKDHIYLEKQHSRPGMAGRAMFSMGEGYGMWRMLITALQIPYTIITPQAWKKLLMAGMPKEKDASRLRALQLFPYLHEELKRKKDHNRADALLIAEYGRRIERS